MSDLKYLAEKSPVRVFEKAVGDTVKNGEAGLISSKKGLGKTGVLVQFGIDALLQGKDIVHASFNQKSADVIGWYESIFSEIAKKKNITDADDILSELIRKRMILNLNQDVVSLSSVTFTVKALQVSGVDVKVVLIDDIDFAKVKPGDLDEMHAFAKNEGITVWMNASYNSAADIPANILAPFDVSLYLDSKSDAVELSVLKFNNKDTSAMKIKLDSKTLLFTDK
jgi:hypothetical protein